MFKILINIIAGAAMIVWAASPALAAVKIKDSDIAVGTIDANKLNFTPIISTSVLQGSTVQFYVSSGTVGLGGLTVLGPLTIADGVSISSTVHVAAFSNTLGSGATFYAFTPARNITLTKLAVTLHTEGTAGSSTWTCGNGATTLNLVTSSINESGDTLVQTGEANIPSGSKVSCLISSTDQFATPTGIWELEYILR